MRIWSLHPKYLDTKGLVALWRETLLAQHVLDGKTSGYRNHPQLNRFKNSKKSTDSINQYLAAVYNESVKRGYNFNKNKINWDFRESTLSVTQGQLKYEFDHLLKKLESRDSVKFQKLCNESEIDAHPLFKIIDGGIEDWEII